jgi:hypothetical protein
VRALSASLVGVRPRRNLDNEAFPFGKPDDSGNPAHLPALDSEHDNDSVGPLFDFGEVSTRAADRCAFAQAHPRLPGAIRTDRRMRGHYLLDCWLGRVQYRAYSAGHLWRCRNCGLDYRTQGETSADT